MPGLCGLLNHSCERRWRRVPLPAGACPLVGFFVIGFSCNANALASVLWCRLVRCPTARAMICLPAGGSFPHNSDTSHGYLVTLPFCSACLHLIRPACCPNAVPTSFAARSP